MEDYLKQNGQLWLVLVCIAAFLLTYLAPVDTSFSDPAHSLLTAQSIVESGTIRLDAYVGDPRFVRNPIASADNGHSYDYFPLGTSLLASPAVWLARLRGEDMLDAGDNRNLQNSLSSLTVVASALLVFALCRLDLPYSASFALSLAFVFGSSIVSTLGTALWSSNSAVVLGLLVLLILRRAEKRDAPAPEVILGGLCFLAYLCRPTMVWLFLAVAVYLGVRNRRLPIRLVATMASFSFLFVVFSLLEFEALLPPYYRPSRLAGDRAFWRALVAHMTSPSRGILIGSPFLVLPIFGCLAFRRRLRREPLLWSVLGWILLHWLTVSSFHHWWGGWSFGNRLLAEVLPAFLLVTVFVAREARRELSARSYRFATALFLAASIWAIFVHSHQGLYNPYSNLWNDGIDLDESRVFDWRHPQFLASAATLGVHERTHALLTAEPYSVGEWILPTSEHVVFEGWSLPEGDGRWRWSNGTMTQVLFRASEAAASAGTLEIEAGTYGIQEIALRVNGHPVGVLRSDRDWEPSTYRFALPETVTESVRSLGSPIFEIQFDIPGAQRVGVGPEERLLGICLRRIALQAGPT